MVVLDAPNRKNAIIRRVSALLSAVKTVELFVAVLAPFCTFSAAAIAMKKAIAANISKANRHCLSVANATGPESATPAPVPALMIVLVAPCQSGCMAVTTATAIGGKASPVLDPASITAFASQKEDGAVAIPGMPTAATCAATMAMERAPNRSVKSADRTMAIQ